MKPFLPTLRSCPTRGLSLGIAVLLALGTSLFQSITARAAETGSTNAPNPLLTVERIFKGGEFGGEGFSAQWLDDSSGYVTWEKPANGGPGQDLVRHDPATDRRDVLLAASELIPAGKTQPLSVDDYAWSADRSKVLIYTNTKKVWRTHARGDYWVLDRTSHELFQLGGDAPASSLQFAKFSPDGTRVAYVRERNLHVQDLRSRKITPLTDTPNEHLIHGAFDWVYEEEFSMQDGFRWSPDSRSIAFWQLDTEGVREVTLVNNTDSLYPQIQRIPYPKTGELNSACRVGVVDASGGDIRWMKAPGDPREHYLHDLQWIPGTRRLLLQQLNRLQNTNRVFVAEASTGEVTELLVDSDKAWVDAHNDLTWHRDARRFLFWSERDGWQHLYWAGLKDGKLKAATRGAFDVTELVRVQEARKEIYFVASPGNPTQRHLYRSSFRGRSLERITPTNAPGTHKYVASPDGRWAFHTVSSFTVPPKTELISLPGVLPGAGGWRRGDRRLVPAAPGVRPHQKIPAVDPRVRRTGRADREGPVGRLRPALALDARPAGLRGDEFRQPRHGHAPGPRVAQVDLSAGGCAGLAGPGRRAPTRAGHPALPGPQAGGHLGLERRRVDDPQRPAPPSRPLHRRHRHRLGPQHAPV